MLICVLWKNLPADAKILLKAEKQASKLLFSLKLATLYISIMQSYTVVTLDILWDDGVAFLGTFFKVWLLMWRTFTLCILGCKLWSI